VIGHRGGATVAPEHVGRTRGGVDANVSPDPGWRCMSWLH